MEMEMVRVTVCFEEMFSNNDSSSFSRNSSMSGKANMASFHGHNSDPECFVSYQLLCIMFKV